MITIFNRREIYNGFSLKEQAEIRDMLSANNIDYQIKMINRNSPGAWSDNRARLGTLGQNLELSYETIIYVHKKDFDFAKFKIGETMRSR